MFKVRAYKSRTAGESGGYTPVFSSSSGSFQTAKHIAQQLAKDCGAAVCENTETGNRIWFIQPPLTGVEK